MTGGSSEKDERLPPNFSEILDQLKAIKQMIGDAGVQPPLFNFKFLAKGESDEGKNWLRGKPQFKGWRPEHFRMLVKKFEDS